MRLQRPCFLPVIAAILFVASLSSAEDTPNSENERHSGRTILAKFDKGDPGWQVRMQSLVRLARAESDAVPALIEALKTGSPTTREFAAQALAMFALGSLSGAYLTSWPCCVTKGRLRDIDCVGDHARHTGMTNAV